MLQDVVLPESPATRPQTLLRLKTNSQRLTKDDLFTMTENLLVNFEEIDSMQRSELNQLKAMTTTLYVNERPAYGRNKVHLPHVASFCATGNNLQFLTDDTGNRRWLPFEVTAIDNPWTAHIDYEGLYAQAKHLLDNDFRYWYRDHEIEAEPREPPFRNAQPRTRTDPDVLPPPRRLRKRGLTSPPARSSPASAVVSG